MTRQTGTCKWFNIKKGFGFVTPSNAEESGAADIFVHQSALNCTGWRSLAEGEEVAFDVEIDDNGREKAANVTAPNGEDLPGGRRRNRPSSEPVEALENGAFFGNLAWTVDENQLAEVLQGYSTTQIEVQRINPTRSKGFALVAFSTADDLSRAITELNGTEIEGREIVIREDRGSTVKTTETKSTSKKQKNKKDEKK